MFNKNQDAVVSKRIETIIGPSVKVEGNFKGEGDIIIDGILIGTLETENNLKVGEGAMIEANIRANNAFIAGKVKGNITIKGKLELSGSAIILGDIKAQMLSIETGARIQGKLSMPGVKIASEEQVKVEPITEENEEMVEEEA